MYLPTSHHLYTQEDVFEHVPCRFDQVLSVGQGLTLDLKFDHHTTSSRTTTTPTNMPPRLGVHLVPMHTLTKFQLKG